MKDYEKRQKDNKGRYKGSIHSNEKKNKQHVSWATAITIAVFVVFILMALGDQ